MEEAKANLLRESYKDIIKADSLANLLEQDDVVVERVLEYFDKIEYLSKMSTPDRKRACDLPRYTDPYAGKEYLEENPNGRIIVDLENPHKLEDMDYFRQAGLHFNKHGRYTMLPESNNVSSPYIKFWLEEERRCKEGYIRHYDGEWIPGYYYFYLNYVPILLTVNKEAREGAKNFVAERIKKLPYVWDGDYFYFHYIDQAENQGLYGNVLKTRGRGFSFKGGGMLARNYTFYPSSKSYAMAAEGEYLTGDGLLTKTWDTIDHLDETTPWRKSRDKVNKQMHKRASYIDPVDNIEKGYKSEIMGVTLKNDTQKARGKRGKIILWEESGNFRGLVTAWGIARPSLEQGRSVFGLMIAFGTGGTEGEGFAGARKMFLNPRTYRIKPLRNMFDKISGKGECGWFVPEYMNREHCYDSDGNSDVIKAMIEIVSDRLVVEEGGDASAITQEAADRPITPEESMMSINSSIFPIADLKERRLTVESEPENYKALEYIGRLHIVDEGNIEWKADNSLHPIYEFPIPGGPNKAQRIAGAIQIYEMPVETGGKIPHGMYIAGTDPYDHDESGTDSLGSTFILNMATDRIVAEYTGRPATAHQYYENVRRLLKFYNAKCNYENALKGMYDYFDSKNELYLLADEPRLIKDVSPTANLRRKKGTPATKQINKYCRELIKAWLLAKAPGEKEKRNLDNLRQLAMLRELEEWNIDGNFDRVSALGMLLFYRQEMNKYPIDVTRVDEISPIARDPWLSKMYGNGLSEEQVKAMNPFDVGPNGKGKIAPMEFTDPKLKELFG